MAETIKSYPQAVRETPKNIYNVPIKQWKKWSENGRLLFNYIYGQGTTNREIVCGTDLFGNSDQIEKILNTTVWNLAWESASYVTYNFKN